MIFFFGSVIIWEVIEQVFGVGCWKITPHLPDSWEIHLWLQRQGSVAGFRKLQT